MTPLTLFDRPIGNVEAEVAVIGAMLCDARVIDVVADKLNPEDFAERFFGYVYSLIVREHSLGRSPNPVTIRPFLEGEQAFHDMGGQAWLAELGASRVLVGSASGEAAHVAELAQRRRLIEGLREAIAQAADLDQPVESLIETADEAISLARDSGCDAGEYSGADCLKSVIDGFDTPITGTTCGIIPSIDELLGPMRRKHLVIGAGRPGMGKTATAVSYALGAAQKGHGVLFVSLEMSAEELGERMAADLCLEKRIPYGAIRDRTLTGDQKREVCRAHARIAELPLQIVDRSGLQIGRLRSLVRRWARRMAAKGHRLDLVIVDYLQLMRADRKMSAYEAVSEISRSLKEIAKENDLAVFALCQLSREVEKRGDKRPQLSDLRDSGQIEQDADAVLFFLREEYYLRLAEPAEDKRDQWQAALDRCQGRIEFICAKRRNGPSGALFGEFLYVYQAVRG